MFDNWWKLVSTKKISSVHEKYLTTLPKKKQNEKSTSTYKMCPVSRNYKKQSAHSDSSSSKMQSPQKSVNPGKMQSNHMWPAQAQAHKKSQVNTSLPGQTSK